MAKMAGPASEQAVENLAQFDEIFSSAHARDGSPTGSAESSVSDPDAYATLKQAVLAAARSSSAERHRVLAEALAMRLRTPTGDDKAVVLNRAIELVPSLGDGHLRILGLLACIRCVRYTTTARDTVASALEAAYQESNSIYPRNKARLESLKGEERRLATAAHNEEFEVVGKQIREIQAELEALDKELGQKCVDSLAVYEQAWDVEEPEALHLAAAGCLNMDLSVFRGLPDQYVSPDGTIGYQHHVVSGALTHGRLQVLQASWERVLQHCTLTPVGLIVGLMIHDQLTSSGLVQAWEWGSLAQVDRRRAGWDGRDPRRFSEDLVKEVKRELVRDEERRRYGF
jgi:hypothetical protein